MNGFENNAIPAGNLAVVAFVVFSFERLDEAAEGVLFERGNVVRGRVPVGRAVSL
jgi:hypothetical protein